MFCTKCGKEIDNDSEFCTQCGTRIKNVAAIRSYVMKHQDE
mgnify:CR=1 FL=1